MFELYLEKPNDMKSRNVVSAPSPKDNEVKIKVIYGGICGSDLRVFKGLLPYASYPCRPGHEILGTVIEAGKNAPQKVGTKVVSFPNTFCGECEQCLEGRTNICKNKKSFGVTVDGLFAQEVILDAKYAVPVPEDMPDERAILVEPFAVNVHALKKAKITKGTRVAVIGAGTEGLIGVALATHLGAEVTAIDVNREKLEIAKRFGNTKAMHPSEVTDETFDVVVEAAGVKQSYEQAMQIVKPGGSIVALGITGDQIDFPALRIVRSEVTIYGTIIYTLTDFAETIEYLRDPAFNVEPILSKIIPCTEYKKAFDDAMSGSFVKIVLDFKEG